MILLASILLVTTGHFLLSAAPSGGIAAFAKQHTRWLMLWRYSCYAVIITLWPYFIAFLGRSQGWTKQVIFYLQHQRLKLLGFFIIIELLFFVNVVGLLFTWF